MAIPKIIHYCNFGNGTSKDTLNRMLHSANIYCPDYKVILWNESNFDISSYEYTKEAAANNKWAFVSDVCRLYALKTMGGVYLDTDVEIVKPLDSILNYKLLFGFESNDRIGTAVIASEKDNTFLEKLLDNYKNRHFVLDNNSMDTTTNVEMVTSELKAIGFKMDNTVQTQSDITLLPKDFFSPKDYESGVLSITSNTYAIHYYASSWKSQEEAMRDTLFFKFKKKLPQKFAWNFANYLAVMKHRGLIQGHKDMFNILRKKV